ncbi:hypothetical protein E1B28_004240 [Marasmius oreades]|uniref:Integral membrane protein S linking to the trans Golgi network-domain-containing protein n=1 Tax=Marasmius oreades TaxID=181124 RepID=A0A9P7UY57_9AGAR|nr:uncharacterized protein E1B28_004240 [Marasmius oreades]KAG7096831.1 hypothetical protein E1B28_004240 [Marasmius oreades]
MTPGRRRRGPSHPVAGHHDGTRNETVLKHELGSYTSHCPGISLLCIAGYTLNHTQIVSLQTSHYLILCLLVPLLLNTFAEPVSLTYEGGVANVGMIMDWREMAGRPTVPAIYDAERFGSYLYSWAWNGGKIVGYSWREDLLRMNKHGNRAVDPMRGWVVAFAWIAACCVDLIPLYALIRRPRLILDFSFTLLFNHLVLTTYYSTSIPTSLFFYLVTLFGTAIMVIVGEQLCVRREMREGLIVAAAAGRREADQEVEEEVESMEMGALPGRHRD